MIVLQLVRCQISNKSISNKGSSSGEQRYSHELSRTHRKPLFSVASEGQVCQAGDVIGRCVPIKEYPEYAAILKKQFRSAQEAQFLNDRFCGYTPARKALVCKPVKINEPHCGRQLTDRIVKGNLTELDEYPWMALFQYKKPKGFGFYCGGALINTRYVLSAAHCFVGLRYGWEVVKVRLGEL